MFDWLNRNAAAVQALASVFSVITTIVLLGITRQYVKLTQELARAAREQLKFQERTFVSEAAQLVTLVDVFLGSLKRIPTAESEGDQAHQRREKSGPVPCDLRNNTNEIKTPTGDQSKKEIQREYGADKCATDTADGNQDSEADCDTANGDFFVMAHYGFSARKARSRSPFSIR